MSWRRSIQVSAPVWRERLRRPPEGKAGVRVGPIHLLGSPAERRFAGILVAVVAWVVYLLLVYGFLAVLFRQIPRTQEWAAAMIEPVGGLLASVGEGFLGLVPRLVVLLVLVVALLAIAAETLRAARKRPADILRA